MVLYFSISVEDIPSKEYLIDFKVSKPIEMDTSCSFFDLLRFCQNILLSNIFCDLFQAIIGKGEHIY